jgi:ABC-type branched-subunit amino acid transport system substrate-binding protein
VALVAALTLGVVVLPANAGAERQQDAAASDIGITDDTIRIAVIADVDQPVRQGVFQGSVDGVRAAAKYINQQGGIAGRKLQVDFIDSRLSPDEARSALVRACEEDFAIVGTTAIFMTNVEPMVNCVDKAGAATGLPDISVLQTEAAQQCSPVSFSIIVNSIDCATADSAEPLVTVGVGHVEYLLEKYKDLHGVWIIPSDLKSTIRASLPAVKAAQEAGIESDGEYQKSALSTQAEFTPIMQAVKEAGSTYVYQGLEYKSALQIRNEAKIQGVDTVKAWECNVSCYDQRFLEEGGEDVEGQYVWIQFVPFNEAKQNKGLATFLKAIGGADEADGFAAQAWAATLFFRDAANAVVEADGENGLTRARFLEEAEKIHDFTADGMLGPIDVGGRKVVDCFVLLQVKKGKFVRVFPKKKGTVDCASEPISLRVALPQ